MNKKNKKKFDVSNISKEVVVCFFCKQSCEEEFINETKNGKHACEECYDPADPEQSEIITKKVDKEITPKEELSLASFNREIYKNKKYDERTITINVNEANREVEIPPELNIIDCPSDINSDKEWFRKQFKNMYRLFTNDSEWVYIIHDRGSGKSKNDAILLLYFICLYADFEGAFIMRDWKSPGRQIKEYFKKQLPSFANTIWQGQKGEHFKDLWHSTYKGVHLKEKVRDKLGQIRCHFFSLFSAEDARTLIDKPINLVVFDECIPNRKDIVQNKGWFPNEPSDYMELVKSLGRNVDGMPKKIFTGNPNDHWKKVWIIAKHFPEVIKDFKKWYWKNRPATLESWLAWSWIKEWKIGNKTLQFQKIATPKEDFDNFEEGNWDNLLANDEDLKMKEHRNGSSPTYLFNDCVHYCSKGTTTEKAFFYFIDINSKEISENDRKLFKYLPEYYVNFEQLKKSNQSNTWDYTGERANLFRRNLIRLYRNNMLFFADIKSKWRIEEFLNGKRKIREEEY